MRTETFSFFWSNESLDADYPAGLPLEVAVANQYALRKQVLEHGAPAAVEKERGTERTLFRLTWHYDDDEVREDETSTADEAERADA